MHHRRLAENVKSKKAPADAIFASVLEPVRHRIRRTANILSGSHLVTLTTLGGVQIHAADDHRQRHAVDFDRQRSGVPATGQLETPAFFAQTTRPSRSP